MKFVFIFKASIGRPNCLYHKTIKKFPEAAVKMLGLARQYSIHAKAADTPDSRDRWLVTVSRVAATSARSTTDFWRPADVAVLSATVTESDTVSDS